MTPAGPARCLHSMVEERAERDPAATALVSGADRVSYADLNARADRLAARLAAAGVRRGSVVGVRLERGVDLVAGVLATLKAGGAYLMLDPAAPAAWLRDMAADAGASVVLARDGASAGAVVLTGGAPHADPGAGAARPGPDDVACVMFTSGSTGRPKGVAASHRAVLETLAGQDYLRFGPGEVWLQCAPVSWDAFALELWGALLFGGTCVLHPGPHPDAAVIGRLVAEHRVTTMYLSGSLFNLIVDERPAALTGLRQLMVGGEAMSPVHAGRALRDLPGLRLGNGYGPVEAMIFVTSHPVVPADVTGASVPIGRPLRGKDVRLLDDRLRPVGGGVGEVYAAGGGLAYGYLGRPGATAERFVPDPWGPPGARMYRTGDLARRTPGGELEFAGRVDDQLKVGGYRVEPAGIEEVLARHPGVRRAAVVAGPAAAGDRRLVAYLVPAGPPPPTEALREHVSAALPRHLVPAEFVVLDALPLTATGKLDRAALPARRPLSRAQRRLWLLDQLDAGVAYTMPVLLRLDGAGSVDAGALRAALSDVVGRHESLRTVFPVHDGEPRPLVLPAGRAGPAFTTYRMTGADPHAELDRVAWHRFDLSSEPPLRAVLGVRAEDGQPLALLLVMHHVAADGWSLAPLLRDLSRAYAARAGGRAPDLPPLPAHHGDPAGHDRLAYWISALAGLPGGTPLPRRPDRPATPRARAATVVRRIEPAGHELLLRLARRQRGSLFMVLHAGLAVLLARAGAGNDIAIGTPVAGRSGEAADDLVGFFVNLLVLRADLSGDPTVRELLARVRAVDLDALAHQDVPFEQVVDALGAARAAGREPLVDVVLALQNTARATLDLGGARAPAEVLRPPAARFDLLVDVTDDYRPGGVPDGITVTVEYRAEVFPAAVMRWLADALPRVLAAMAAEPDSRIGQLAGVPDLPPDTPPAVRPDTGPPAAAAGDRAPGTDLERRLAAIWADVLGVERVGADDDFFALGGNSLSAVRAAARIATAERLPVTPAHIFAAPTVAQLARKVAAEPAAPQPRIPRLPRTPRPAAGGD